MSVMQKQAFRTAKSRQDFTLAGVDTAIEEQNGSVTKVTITDANGKSLSFSSVYGMTVLVPKEPEKETKHVVTGTIAKVPVREVFDDSYTALERERELTRAGAEVETAPEEVEIPF